MGWGEVDGLGDLLSCGGAGWGCCILCLWCAGCEAEAEADADVAPASPSPFFFDSFSRCLLLPLAAPPPAFFSRFFFRFCNSCLSLRSVGRLGRTKGGTGAARLVYGN
jgi:hypothetical protein